MKEESVLNVLMYLVKNCFRRGNAPTSYSRLLEKLEDAGFDPQLVSRTFVWVRQLVREEKSIQSLSPREGNPVRVYTVAEMERLDLRCRGFLTYLEQCAILKPNTREMVIHQAMALDEEIDVNLLKWITLLVLLTQPNEQDALSRIEFLILDSPTDLLH